MEQIHKFVFEIIAAGATHPGTDWTSLAADLKQTYVPMPKGMTEEEGWEVVRKSVHKAYPGVQVIRHKVFPVS